MSTPSAKPSINDVVSANDEISVSLVDIGYSILSDGEANLSRRFLLSIPCDFDRVKEQNPKIVGYKIKAKTQGESSSPVGEWSAYFIEDFHDNVYVGENDYESLEKLVLEPRQTIRSVIGGPNLESDSVLSQAQLETWYNNYGEGYSSNFIKRDASTNSLLGIVSDPVSANSKSPPDQYSLPKIFVSSVGSDGNSPLFLSNDEYGNLKSLTATRALLLQTEDTDTEFDPIQASLDLTTSNKEKALGLLTVYSSPIWKSERIIELKAEDDGMSEVNFEIEPILDVPSGEIPTTTATLITASTQNKLNTLLSPTVPCSIECTYYTPGSCTVKVTKRDPILEKATVMLKSKHSFFPDQIPYVDAKAVVFNSGETVKSVNFEGIYNTFPFNTSITCLNNDYINPEAWACGISTSIPGIEVNREINFGSQVNDQSLMTLESKETGVQVKVDKLSDLCTNIKILRVGMKGDGSEEVVYDQPVLDSKSPVIWLDENVVSRNMYIYRVIYRYLLRQVTSSNSAGKPSPSISYEFEQEIKSLPTSSSVFESYGLPESSILWIKPKNDFYTLDVDPKPIIVSQGQGSNPPTGLAFKVGINKQSGGKDYDTITQMLKSIGQNFENTDLDNEVIPFVGVTRRNLVNNSSYDLGYTLGKNNNFVVDTDILKTYQEMPTLWESKYVYEFRLYLPKIAAIKAKTNTVYNSETSADIENLISAKQFDVYLDDQTQIASLNTIKDTLNLESVIENAYTGLIYYSYYDPYEENLKNIQKNINFSGQTFGDTVSITWSVSDDPSNSSYVSKIKEYLVYVTFDANYPVFYQAYPADPNGTYEFHLTDSITNSLEVSLYCLMEDGTIADTGRAHSRVFKQEDYNLNPDFGNLP